MQKSEGYELPKRDRAAELKKLRDAIARAEREESFPFADALAPKNRVLLARASRPLTTS